MEGRKGKNKDWSDTLGALKNGEFVNRHKAHTCSKEMKEESQELRVILGSRQLPRVPAYRLGSSIYSRKSK